MFQKLDFTRLIRCTEYFKLNISILLEKLYQQQILNAITEATEINVDTNHNTLWELIKDSIRKPTMYYQILCPSKENKPRTCRTTIS